MTSMSPSQRSLDGRVAILTGVSRRGQVGEAVAQWLAERGAAVVLIDRTGVEAEARASELRDRGYRATAFGADLTSASQLDAVSQSVASAFDGIDALVNIAGGFSMSGKVSDSDPEAWARQLAIGSGPAVTSTAAGRTSLATWARASTFGPTRSASTSGESTT